MFCIFCQYIAVTSLNCLDRCVFLMDTVCVHCEIRRECQHFKPSVYHMYWTTRFNNLTKILCSTHTVHLYGFLRVSQRTEIKCVWSEYWKYGLVSITNLMHNSFIIKQYICYVIILDMFRVIPCSSSGGQIVLLQHLVSSLSINGCTVRRLRADCSQPAHCTAVYREWRYQML